MILAELAAHVAERLENVGDRRIFRLQTEVGAGQADLGQAGADRRLPGDERGPPCCTTLLSVPVGEVAALFGDAVDVRGAIPHDAVVVEADVEPTDVVAPDDQDVGLVGLRHFVSSLMLSGPNCSRSAAAVVATATTSRGRWADPRRDYRENPRIPK